MSILNNSNSVPHVSIQIALNDLFDACAMGLPYLEALFKQSLPGSPDYFALTKLIIEMTKAMEQARDYRRATPDTPA